MIMEGKYIKLIPKYVSKPFVFLKQRKLAISSDTPHFSQVHTGYGFAQIMRDHNSTFHKFKVLSYLRQN